MKSLLLPQVYKKIGWFLLFPAFIAGLYLLIWGTTNTYNPRIKTYGYFGSVFASGKPVIRFDYIELIPNLFSILFLVVGILVMFSKEKKEDEYINQIRLNALQYAVFVNYILLFLCMISIHSFEFLNVLFYNLFTIIIIYILRFHFLIYKNSTNNNEQ